MRIELNGKAFELAGGTLADLLAQLGLADKRLAVEKNGEVVVRSEHATCALAEGDRIELVQAIGGG